MDTLGSSSMSKWVPFRVQEKLQKSRESRNLWQLNTADVVVDEQSREVSAFDIGLHLFAPAQGSTLTFFSGCTGAPYVVFLGAPAHNLGALSTGMFFFSPGQRQVHQCTLEKNLSALLKKYKHFLSL